MEEIEAYLTCLESEAQQAKDKLKRVFSDTETALSWKDPETPDANAMVHKLHLHQTIQKAEYVPQLKQRAQSSTGVEFLHFLQKTHQSGQDAILDFWQRNRPLALAFCQKSYPYWHELSFSEQEETLQEIQHGLLIAIQKFDYRKGFQFSTYAQHWMLQRRYRVRYQLPVHDSRMLSLEAPRYDDDDQSLGEKLIDPRQNVEETTTQSLTSWELEQAIAQLDRIDQSIVTKNFGLDGQQPKNVAQIAEEMKFSQAYIRDRLRSLLFRMKSLIEKKQTSLR